MWDSQNIPVRIDRLMDRLENLAQFGRTEAGGVNRPCYSAAYQDAVDWLIHQMKNAGLSVRIDMAGNVIGRLGPVAGPVVICGSHIDSVPDGGKYDGTLGVLAGIEVAQTLNEHSIPMDMALEIIAFADEEGSYLSLLGACAMIGDLSYEDLHDVRGRDGSVLIDTMKAYGIAPDEIATAARDVTQINAYVELHIEQGPVLEEQSMDIGIVEAIVGLHTSEIKFMGEANHAGTTPLRLRRDPFRSAAAMMTKSFANLEKNFPPEVRLTYGKIDVQPGAANVVPSSACLTQEIRARDMTVLNEVFDMTKAIADTTARDNRVEISSEICSVDQAVPMSKVIISAIEQACMNNNTSYCRMVSGAGHDAQVMARVCDSGMIFVPSARGLSHNVEEYTDQRQIEVGLRTLAATLCELLKHKLKNV